MFHDIIVIFISQSYLKITSAAIDPEESWSCDDILLIIEASLAWAEVSAGAVAKTDQYLFNYPSPQIWQFFLAVHKFPSVLTCVNCVTVVFQLIWLAVTKTQQHV
jgi:hypothetical protein